MKLGSHRLQGLSVKIRSHVIVRIFPPGTVESTPNSSSECPSFTDSLSFLVHVSSSSLV